MRQTKPIQQDAPKTSVEKASETALKRNREGNIVEKKDGRIYARVQFIDETGKQRDKYRRAESRTHARTLIREMRDELLNYGETALQSDKITFADLAETYEKSELVPAVIRAGKKISGLRSHANTRLFLKPLTAFFGRANLRTIKPSDVKRYRNQRLNTPTVSGKSRAVASVNRELELLRSMFYFAKREKWILTNPFEGEKAIILKTAENERDRTLLFDEEKRLLNCFEPRTKTYKRRDRKTGELKDVTATYDGTDRRYLKALIVTALDTAMRRGELFKLTWRDVDFRFNTIHVLAQNAKTEKSRVVGMTERVKAELEHLWNISPKEKTALVFGITSTIKHLWQTVLNEAVIEDLRFHDLRHTAITRFVRSGVPHAEVMKISGHTQIKTFLRYLNLSNEAVTSSANRLSEYLAQQTQPGQTFDKTTDFVN